MRVAFLGLFAVLRAGVVTSNDRFNYNETDWESRDFGPADWGEVECNNVNNCVSNQRFLFFNLWKQQTPYFLCFQQPGWPTNWDMFSEFIDFDSRPNACLDCSESTTGACRRHRQSPINLERSITSFRQCKDWHRMHFNKGNCRFENMRFEIMPHVLRAYQPKDGCQVDPCIDFSHGFP